MVLIREDVSAGTREFLVATTASSPGGDGYLVLPMGDHSFDVEPGDRVTLTYRARNVVSAAQISGFPDIFLEVGCEPGDAGCFCQSFDNHPTQSDGGLPSTVNANWSARVADDFIVTARTSVRAISWWGAGFDEITSQGCGATSFTIRLYEDAGGLPGGLVDAPIEVSDANGLTIQEIGQNLFRNGERLYPGRFRFELASPIVLPGAGIYWLEIVESLGGSCSWLWERAEGGNQYSLRDVGMTGYGAEDVLAGDLAFCVSLEEGQDCNNNQREDAEDIAAGSSADTNANGIPDECEPVFGCVGKLNSQGVVPSISTSGQPTLTGPDNFHLEASGVIAGQLGVLMWGFQPSPTSMGQVSPSRWGSTICIFGARATGHQLATGTPGLADGSLSFHFTQSVMGSQGWLLGESVYAQWLYMDPLHPDGSGLGHTGSVRVQVLP